MSVLYALGSTLFAGLAETLTKKTVTGSGRFRAIVYNYILVVLLIAAGALVLGIPFVFPAELIPIYLVQCAVGAAAVSVYFKAFEYGQASILSPLSCLYVLVVVFLGAVVFGESLSMQQLGGAALVLLAGFVLAFEDIKTFKLEKGVLYVAMTIVGWGFYYSFIKVFIPPMGAYMATLFLEAGVGFFVISYYVARGKDLSPPPRNQAGLIAVRSVIIFFGALLYTYAVAGIGVSLTSVIAAGTPLISVPASRILLGEKMSAYKYASVLLIVIGLVLVLA